MKIKDLKKLFILLICLIFISVISNFREDNPHPYNEDEVDFTELSLSNGEPYLYEWYFTWGGSARDVCYDFIMDSSGNYYLVGETWSYDICLVKFNSNGEYVWHRITGSSGFDMGHALTIDSSDNIYVGGRYGQNQDYCLLKYDPSGNLLLSRTWGGANSDVCYSIALDDENNIYLAGKSDSYGHGVPGDMCLVKFNSSGDYQWHQVWGGTSSEWCYDIKLDSAKNIYMAGYTNSVSESISACVVKLNESGDFLWYRTWNAGHPSMFSSRFYAITIDRDDNIYLTGRSERFGSHDVCTIKYNSAGTLQWARTWSGSATDEGYDISILNGDVYIGGYTGDYHDGNRQMCLLKYNNSGTFEWVKTWGGSTTEECYSIKFNEFNDLYIAGKTASYGSGNYDYCLVKFNTPPKMEIYAPIPIMKFGVNAPEYNLSIFDYETSWYNLNNGVNQYFTNLTGQIDQTAWDLCDNGTVLITFNAIDTAGALRQIEFSVWKDDIAPQITIQKPEPFKVYGNTTIGYELSIDEGNFDSSWYNLNDGINYTLIGNSGTIDQDVWDQYVNGTIFLRFYANDTLGNLGFEDISIYKDVLLPEIIIENPTSGQLFRDITPKFNLSIQDADLNYSWYVIENNSAKYFFSEFNGTIDQVAWDLLQNGTVLISFYANNSIGNLAQNDIVVNKDIEPPIININSPYEGQFFGTSSFWFDLTILEGNLDSIWYSLNNGLNVSFSGTNGTIDQDEWDKCENGTVLLKFYANDSLGYLTLETVTVNKDIHYPIIEINTPITAQLVGKNAFKYNISVFEPNLDTLWFTLNDSSPNIIFDTLGNIDQTIWDQYDSGVIEVKFYANDTAGNISFDVVNVNKDSDQIIESDLRSISPISIDPTGSRGVPWSEIVLNDWCSGSGTQSNPYIIEYISIKTNTYGSCIEIYNSNSYFIIRYSSFSYATRGYPYVSDYSAGIKLHGTDNGQLIENNCHNNLVGILIEDGYSSTSDYNLLQKNRINNNYYGVHIAGDYNNIIQNNIYDNAQCGIRIDDAIGYITEKNIVKTSGYCGIYLTQTASSTSIRHNIIKDNDDYGIYIYYGTNNIAYNNTFIGNGINAADDGTNLWYSGLLGNYWDDYQGVDNNDNGIGDSPYTGITGVGGRQDNYPIWWDSPLINITSPFNDDIISATAPGISYDVWRGIVDTVWYDLFDGNTKTHNYTYLTSIDQVAWDQMNDGDVWISFYVNDTNGWESSDTVKVIKDSIGRPQLSISGIYEGEIYSKSAPSGLNIFVTDPDGVDDVWYRLYNGTYSTANSTWLGYIEQNIWDLISNGSLSIIFYANDTLNNLGSRQISIWKDIIPPNIDLSTPNESELFGFNVPFVDVDFSDINGVSDRWYNLFNATYTTSNYTWTGSIDPLIWGELGNGTVNLRIWANDTLNNIAYTEVSLFKDIIAPYLSLITPLNGGTFNETAPDFSLSIYDNNLDDIWYSLDNGITNFSCSMIGTIDQSSWSALPDGPMTLRFNANDTLGNIRIIQIIIRKDTAIPEITIISPTLNQHFPLEAPEFTIVVDEANLDTLWYTIDGGLTNITFTSNQTINQNEWTDQSDGTIILVFYANDTLGHVNWTTVSLIKDSVFPIINLLDPSVGETYGKLAPNFTIAIFDANLDDMWYTLDGGITNIPFTTNGTLDQSEWASHTDGFVTIIFYAKDFAGNEYNIQLNINKDSSAPLVTIITPLLNEYLSHPPQYSISITEHALDSYWYTIDGGITNISLSELSGTLEDAEWFATLDGPVTIRFYANDSYSNENYAEITINKDTTTPIVTIISPEDDQEYQEYPPGYLIEIDEDNLDSYWYTLDGGLNNYTITELTDSIGFTTWENAAKGAVTIEFYARDLAGNIGTDSVTLIKNTAGYEPPLSPGILGYDLYLLIGALSVISALLIRKRLKS